MVHRKATIELGPTRRLEVGITVCFGEPAVYLLDPGGDPKTWKMVEVPVSAVDALIAALSEARTQALANDPR